MKKSLQVFDRKTELGRKTKTSWTTLTTKTGKKVLPQNPRHRKENYQQLQDLISISTSAREVQKEKNRAFGRSRPRRTQTDSNGKLHKTI